MRIVKYQHIYMGHMIRLAREVWRALKGAGTKNKHKALTEEQTQISIYSSLSWKAAEMMQRLSFVLTLAWFCSFTWSWSTESTAASWDNTAGVTYLGRRTGLLVAYESFNWQENHRSLPPLSPPIGLSQLQLQSERVIWCFLYFSIPPG